jgi:hypothetical protein
MIGDLPAHEHGIDGMLSGVPAPVRTILILNRQVQLKRTGQDAKARPR